jgi:hypothetical protein
VIYDSAVTPRGFATNDEQTDITTFEARLRLPDSESRLGWLVGAFYSKEKGQYRVSISFIRDYEDPACLLL